MYYNVVAPKREKVFHDVASEAHQKVEKHEVTRDLLSH